MPRLSLYRSDKSNDYKFLDRSIKEMFTVGATDLYIHKYLGITDQGATADLTQPRQTTPDPTKIQDLLFLENRDRKYDTSIYRIRGHYNVQNLDFDLSQFGLFLTNDVIFITIHYNDMIDIIGRKLMVGDVFELPHLTDYHPLNETIPVGLRRYYQITDANFASEGFSQTWFPHLWRIKCEPLVDSQEFSNILSQPLNKDNYLGDWNSTSTYVTGYTVTYGDKTYTPIPPGPVPAGIAPTDTTYWQLDTADNLRDILGRYNTNIAINDAAIAEAARLVPKTGYDRSQLYVVPTTNGQPGLPVNIIANSGAPVPIRPTLQMISTPGYRNPSPVLRIGAAALRDLETLGGDDFDALRKFISLNLETAKLAPERNGSSGQVDGNLVLTAKAVGDITGPYGTSDNTFSTSDQMPTQEFRATGSLAGSVIIGLSDISDQIMVGCEVSASVTSPTGSLVNPFPVPTRVIDVDLANNQIAVDSPITVDILSGSTITISGEFTGTVTSVMDFRADCDPRFNFILRVTPQGFGYLGAYMSGDGTAPNGLPVKSGISFPSGANQGDYFLRTDYVPNLLYRYDGNLWVRISENVRATPGMNQAQSQLGSFINNTNVTTLTNGTTMPEQQSLSEVFKIITD